MMLTCGTRGMRARSSGRIGLQSGSAIAAAWRSSCVMASAALQSVLVSVLRVFFMLRFWFKEFGVARYVDQNYGASGLAGKTEKAHSRACSGEVAATRAHSPGDADEA